MIKRIGFTVLWLFAFLAVIFFAAILSSPLEGIPPLARSAILGFVGGIIGAVFFPVLYNIWTD